MTFEMFGSACGYCCCTIRRITVESRLIQIDMPF